MASYVFIFWLVYGLKLSYGLMNSRSGVTFLKCIPMRVESTTESAKVQVAFIGPSTSSSLLMAYPCFNS